ncbi:MAG: DUF2339 domain-containing protein [Patescibacteria group bacterium]
MLTFIVVVILTVVMLVKITNLKERVIKLEGLVAGKKSVTPVAPDYQTAPNYAQVNTPVSSPASALYPAIERPSKFGLWLKEDWLLKLGALLLLIGFGWLTSYAFLHNWIGPNGRIMLGLMAGVLFIILGFWRIRKYLHQGGIFLVLGSTTILLTTFAAQEIYQTFTPLMALAIMFLSTVFVAVASVKYNARTLALASLILAGVAPFLTNSPTTDFTALFMYLMVVVLGTIWVSVLMGHRELTLAALVLVVLYSLPHLTFNFGRANLDVLIWFAYAFAVIFFITNTANLLKTGVDKITADLLAALGNGLLLLIWIMRVAPAEWQSLIIIFWMMVFMIGAFAIFKVTKKFEPFFVYAGVGVVMLAAATFVELKDSLAVLTMVYTIESMLAALLTYAVIKNLKLAELSSWLLVGPIWLSFSSLTSRRWATGVIHEDFFVLAILGVVLFTLGLFFWQLRQESKDGSETKMPNLLLVTGSLYAYILLWLSLHATNLTNDLAVMTALVVYTIIGLVTYLYGRSNEKKGLRIYGGLLLGFVVARLITIDVWQMDIGGRIVTFFFIGALLMSTAFLGRKKKVVSNTLLLLLVSSTFLYSAPVWATPPGPPEPYFDLSAYRLVKEVGENKIEIPEIIEVPFTGEIIERYDFLLLDNETIPRPFFLKRETKATPLQSLFPLLVDGDPNTYTDFSLKTSESNRATIDITSAKPITTFSLALQLAPNVALPTAIEVKAVINGESLVVVGEKSLIGQRINFINFPETTASQWQINLTYSQPLRIGEIFFMEKEFAVNNTTALRFLAELGHSYKIYFNPDREVRVGTIGELGNLATLRVPTRILEIKTLNNPDYVIADTDKDGVANIEDNCVQYANLDQVDINQNGRGDACDDFDADGVLNAKDNCVNKPNASQLDDDGDGIGNTCDTEEGRLTERLVWLPWVVIGLAGVVLVVLLGLTLRAKPPENTPES